MFETDITDEDLRIRWMARTANMTSSILKINKYKLSKYFN